MNNLFRSLPSVDACLSGLENAAPVLYATTPRPLLRSLTNAFLDGCRRDIKEGRLTDSGQLGLDALLPRLAAFAEKEAAPRFRRVLNATGVVIHTNMGRSVLADEAVNAILKACRGYSNLELNLATGERGSRYSHVEELLCTLTGAEAALVVNNNAAAVLITMDALCSGGEVVVARGQLVEIGGSFRIPDVMERSGATLRVDKMTLAALEATLRLYLDEQLARKRIPTVAMITAAPDELKRRASRLASRLRKACGDKAEIRLARGESRVGGGSFPENALPTTL